MTANSRPNLGGLFSGSTPPERSSSIAAALGSAGTGDQDGPSNRARARPSSAGQGTRSASSARTGAPPLGAPVPPIGAAPTSKTGLQGRTADQWAALQWLDPVRVLGYYFDVVQTVFDVQRRLTMGVATAITAPVRRAGVWR